MKRWLVVITNIYDNEKRMNIYDMSRQDWEHFSKSNYLDSRIWKRVDYRYSSVWVMEEGGHTEIIEVKIVDNIHFKKKDTDYIKP